METQVLILGSGIAGLSTALKYARKGAKVTVVCKADLAEGATRYAQGGIAAVWAKQDSFEEHQQDTLVAGAGLCRENIVDLCVHEGPARVQELIDLGVAFTKAHSPFRRSGRSFRPSPRRWPWPATNPPCRRPDREAIEKALIDNARHEKNITILEHHVAIDLITEGKLFKRWRKPGRCLGAYVLNSANGQILTLASKITVLATGGAGKVYLYTTNPDTSTGDGIAMAYRAGAKVANLEFMQFHPTCLYHPSARTFLITEAIRGEGAILKNPRRRGIHESHHPMADLAPRDIVARAIDMEMKRTGDKHVWLDATHLPAEEIRKKFPNIYETCLKYGIDITTESDSRRSGLSLHLWRRTRRSERADGHRQSLRRR